MTFNNTGEIATVPRPIVLISRCVGFEPCRWNGDTIASPYVEKLKKHVDFITTCPECDIGLGIPRKPLRLVLIDGEVAMLQHETNYNATADLNTYSDNFLRDIKPFDGFILKERSPSCGMNNVKVYASPEKGAMVCRKGTGLFATCCLNRFPLVPCASEGHLFNFFLREHFYTQIFALTRFRSIQMSSTINDLVKFHTSHKLILMSYHQTIMRRMGKLVANPEGRNIREVFLDYSALLRSALARPPRTASPINVLMHTLGYFSEKITSGEKKFFLDLLEQYRLKMVPLSLCTTVIKSWIVRFNEPYLKNQFFFNPYPDDLIELSDSGK
jgi:uncharacterized protein YbgA (DUF1722 family)/uncharacterized protein YbbK (DUF523 family)